MSMVFDAATGPQPHSEDPSAPGHPVAPPAQGHPVAPPAPGHPVAPPAPGHAVAPPAPGRLGEPVEPVLAQRYLDALAIWVRQRRNELDELDHAILTGQQSAGGAAAGLTSDISLSLMVWKATSDRLQLLVATWNGGRVGPAERARLSSLIWGRLDATLDPGLISRAGRTTPSAADDRAAQDMAAGLAVSLPEACRLSDALAGQLRARLRLDPAADESAMRVRDLRASVERIRDQVGLEPTVSRPQAEVGLHRLSDRVEQAYQKAQRGGDVGGLLGPLEIETARTERDLIVGAAKRRDARDKVVRARELRNDLEAREAALTQLAQRCIDRVEPAPRFAVPDVDALGPVPNTPAALEGYLARLDRVAKALTFAQDRYAAALTEHDELAGLLSALTAKAAVLGVAGHPDLVAAATLAGAVLGRRPAPMPVCRQLVESYQTWLDWITKSRRTGESATSARPRSRQT